MVAKVTCFFFFDAQDQPKIASERSIYYYLCWEVEIRNSLAGLIYEMRQDLSGNGERTSLKMSLGNVGAA